MLAAALTGTLANNGVSVTVRARGRGGGRGVIQGSGQGRIPGRPPPRSSLGPNSCAYLQLRRTVEKNECPN